MPIKFYRIVLGLLLMFGIYKANAGLSSRKFIDPPKEKISEKIVNYIDAAENLYVNNSDSAFLNAYLALNIAIQQKHPEEIVFVNSYLAKYYAYNNQNVKAFNLLQKATEVAQKNKLEVLEFYCLLNSGITAAKQNAFTQSMKYFKDAERIALKLKDYVFLFRVKEAYGLNYLVMANVNLKLAAAYFFEAYLIAKKNNDRYLIAIANKHRAAVKMKTSDFDDCVFMLKGEIIYFNKINDYDEIGDCMAYIGDCYYYQKKVDSSMYFYQEAYRAKKMSNNKDEMAILSTDIAYMYAEKGRMDMFEKYSNESLSIIETTKNYKAKEYVYRWLGELYEKLGNYKDALEMHKAHEIVNDTIRNTKKLEEFAKVSTEKEYELKIEKEKAEHEKNLMKERIENEHANRVKKFFMLAFAITLVFVFVIFREYRIKRKQKSIIENQKSEVEKQKFIIEEKNKEITDSINYAKRIQYSLLANNELLKNNLPDHFILFKPKDIVSGDFYWATYAHDSFYLAICDSTGHGVPGAFMSLLNISYLNEAIVEKNIQEPNEVLNQVRKNLIQSMEGAKDGMDGTLVRFEKNKITYASAHNHPILIRNNEIIELDADKMPIGKGELHTDFALRTVEIHKKDMLYFYTDGFADQFGGPKGKKFKYKNLNELLLKLASKELGTIQSNLEQAFKNWQGDLEQVDDVCIIGIRIS